MNIDIAIGGERLPMGQRPLLPGSPSSPPHTLTRRFAYALVGLVVGITGGLGNALITVNLAQLQGALGLYSEEINWLPTAYAMTNVAINLLLIKFRIQFGLRLFTLCSVGLYGACTALHLLVSGVSTAILVRAASGVAAAGLNTLTLYYVMQAAPARWRLKSVAIGLSIPQLAIPLARLFSTELLALGEWHALYLFELGLALVSFAAVLLVPLPPSERAISFTPLDFVTFPILATGLALLCIVLGLGRVVWWTDAPWLGWTLAAAIPLIVTGLMIEHHRESQSLATRWLGSALIVRYFVISIMVRLVLSEQSTGAVGLFNALGLTNDQLHPLFLIVLLATAAGAVVGAIFINPEKTVPPIILAVALVSVGSFLDAGSTNLSRPSQFYLTQALIAFSSTLFIGPALLLGLGDALTRGTAHIVSFVALFGLTQTLGGLVGPAVLGTFQVVREKAHSHALVDHLTLADPLVAARVQQGAGALAATVSEPGQRTAQGLALLARQASLEANVMAFNDVFILVGILALGTTAYLGYILLLRQRRQRRLAAASAAS